MFQVNIYFSRVATRKIVDIKASRGNIYVLLNPIDIFIFTKYPLALFTITSFYS